MATITVLDSLGATQTVAKVAATGATTSALSLPVVTATDDVIQGALTETAPATDTASSGHNGRLQRIAQRLTTLIAQFPTTIGRTTSAASISVVSASDDALMGIVTETAPASDTASSGLNGRLQRVAQNLTTLNTTLGTANTQLPTTIGRTTSAASLSVVSASDDALMGIVTETAPASDTASSGLNGRLQRIAQRITSLIALLPSALGSTTRAGSLSTVLATSGFSAAVTLTRTADTNAYLANDVLGAATGSTAALTFSSIAPAAGAVLITSVSLQINDTGVISGETTYRLHLYSVTPPSALGDNAAWDLPSGDRASYLGYVDLGTPVDLGSTLFVQSLSYNKQVTTAGTSLFGYLTTIGPYTPTSARVYVVTLNTVSV